MLSNSLWCYPGRQAGRQAGRLAGRQAGRHNSETRSTFNVWRRVSLSLCLVVSLRVALHATFHEETPCKKAFLIPHMCAPFWLPVPRPDNDGDNLWKLPQMAILNAVRRRWGKFMANKKKETFAIKLEQYTFTPSRKITMNLEWIYRYFCTRKNLAKHFTNWFGQAPLSRSGWLRKKKLPISNNHDWLLLGLL